MEYSLLYYCNMCEMYYTKVLVIPDNSDSLYYKIQNILKNDDIKCKACKFSKRYLRFERVGPTDEIEELEDILNTQHLDKYRIESIIKNKRRLKV